MRCGTGGIMERFLEHCDACAHHASANTHVYNFLQNILCSESKTYGYNL